MSDRTGDVELALAPERGIRVEQRDRSLEPRELVSVGRCPLRVSRSEICFRWRRRFTCGMASPALDAPVLPGQASRSLQWHRRSRGVKVSTLPAADGVPDPRTTNGKRIGEGIYALIDSMA
ncbi:MAG: hypothetical protein ACYCV7_02000 [Acidimicrobiales bacterium]